jgi:hypothetical protein
VAAHLHPLADSVHDGYVHTETRAPVVHLSPARADLFLRAQQTDLRVVLVSDELTRLTDPYRDAMNIFGGRWVVRSDDGALRDGLNGRALNTIDDAFSPLTDASPISERFLTLRQPDQVQLIVSASVRHRADDAVRLGRSLEVLTILTGATTPIGWGPHEPVEHPWNKDELTAHVQKRMPSETRLSVVGSPEHPLIATLTARRTNRGVEEIITAVLGVGEPASQQAARALSDVPGILAELATNTLPLFALAFARVGRRDLMTTPYVQQNPEPVALLLGAPAVKELRLDPTALARTYGAIVTGRPRVPALVFPLRTGQPHGDTGWPRLIALVEQIGPDRIERLTGRDLRRSDSEGAHP